MLEIITVSLHKQHFGDNIRTECWGKYSSLCGVIVDLTMNRGLYCLNPHHALVILTQPISAFFRQCSRAFDWHLHSCARTSVTPVVATLHTSPHFSEHPTSASCDCVCDSKGCDIA